MNDFKYVSDDYNINKTIAYRLSIQLNPDGFSVLIADAHKNILFLFHRHGENFAECLNELKENMDLFPVYQSSVCKGCNHWSTPTNSHLVPAVYYSEDMRDLYFRYNHPLMDYEQVITNQAV